MTISTWSWDDIGYPQKIDIIEKCHTINHAYGGGYAASRAGSHKMQKLFTLTYPGMPKANWVNLIEFWRSVYGSADAFYWEYPEGIYGSPSYGGEVIGDPNDGFDTDYEVGFGCGPVFTCRFAENDLIQEWSAIFPEIFAIKVSIFEVA
jgi:hypothetical protein